MLQVESFDISDAKGVNKLLKEFGLASGMHILVSDGKIMVPYMDGQPRPKSVVAAEIGEQRNTLIEQREIIEHSEKVNDQQIADAKSSLEVARAEEEVATANPVRSAARAKRKEVEETIARLEKQSRQNKFEITRLNTNVEEMEAKIKELTK